MTTFEIHTIASAPEGSAPALRTLEQGLGFVPNLAATMAASPALVNGFVDLRGRLAGSDLTGPEREIVALAVSRENGCDYCMAAHSTFALMQDAGAAARGGEAPAGARLGALYVFARALAATRGHVGEDETRAFLDADWSRGALFDVIAQVGVTTLANLAHNVSGVPVDDAFAPQVWAPGAA
jgi:AhpD family alkylhydroperoxidase